MLKLTMEIVDEKLIYDFKCGKESGGGTKPISISSLILFISTLKDCHRHWDNKTAREIKDIECFAYLEKHPELIKEFKSFKNVTRENKK